MIISLAYSAKIAKAQTPAQTSSLIEAGTTGRLITEGSTIRIKHRNTNNHLHSHPNRYPTGSKQQEVTGYWGRDANDLWIIRHKSGHRNNFHGGDIVYLTHVRTTRNLHSHRIKSPVTHQQEVSAYGKNGRGDSNDFWRVILPRGGRINLNSNFRLQHVNTGKYLHSHKNRLTRGTRQQEVTAYGRRDSNDYWFVSEVLSSPRPARTVTEGRQVRIIHENTHSYLHSHGIRYPSGSRQQEVTGFSGRDANDLWTIRHKSGHRNVFRNGDIVYLTHVRTRKNLHSHRIKSPVTHQQEVSAYGKNGKGDSNDFWRVILRRGKKITRGENFRLQHVNTGKFLHSHRNKLRRGSRQQEVTAYGRRDSNDNWFVSDLL